MAATETIKADRLVPEDGRTLNTSESESGKINKLKLKKHDDVQDGSGKETRHTAVDLVQIF